MARPRPGSHARPEGEWQNAIELLPTEYSEAFPQFAEGDLLVGPHNLDMVAVLDGESHRILWVLQGPWLHQQDPDWQPDGTISVFNNNYDRRPSHITGVDPRTNELSIPIGSEGVKFYMLIMGNHQRLPNGNWLIVSSWEGRVIEVTATGAPVLKFSNVINDGYNAVVMNAEHLPPGYFDTLPVCSSN